MSPLQQLAQTLKQHGQSLTMPRRLVFAALEGEEPLTMNQVVKRCPTIDRASVYRAIALFERLGIVQRLQAGWKYRLELSDAFHAHHHHASCLQCGQTIPLHENLALEQLLQSLAAVHHFKLERHQLELQGLCQNCQISQ